jgi:hypothetical protein
MEESLAMAEHALEEKTVTEVRSNVGRRRLVTHILIILGCGALFRALYLYTFKPGWSGDTYGYWIQFHWWTQRTFSIAERPPVYALFFGLVQWLSGAPAQEQNPTLTAEYLVVVLQSVLGLATALLVYFSLRAIGVRPKLALSGGIAFSLIGAVCLMEMLLLTEALSMFLLALGVCLFLRCMSLLQARRGFATAALLSGFSFSLAALTRPENLIFDFLIIVAVGGLSLRCWFLPSVKWASPALAKLALLMVVSVALPVFFWMSWNLITIGVFRMNTITGATRTESVYNMFDKVDDPQDKVAGELLQRSYLLKNRNGEIYRHHVWVAMPYLLKAAQAGALPVHFTDNVPSNPFLLRLRAYIVRSLHITEPIVNGRAIYQPIVVYDYLGALSGKLARRHPILYLRNVVENFFEDTFDYSYAPFRVNETKDPHAPEGGTVVRSQITYPLTRCVNWIERPLLTASYLVLLGLAFFAPWRVLTGKTENLLADLVVATLAVAVFGTMAAICFIAAYYPGHGVPFFSIYTICTFYVAGNFDRIRRAIAARRGKGRPVESTLAPAASLRTIVGEFVARCAELSRRCRSVMESS